MTETIKKYSCLYSLDKKKWECGLDDVVHLANQRARFISEMKCGEIVGEPEEIILPPDADKPGYYGLTFHIKAADHTLTK